MSSTAGPPSPAEAFTPLQEIAQIHQSILKAHHTGTTRSYEWRTHQLKQIVYLLQDNEALFEEALATDLGRPKLESHVVELSVVKAEVIDTLKSLKNWMKPKNVKTGLAWSLARPKILHEPKGVILIFGAWNYPVTLLLAPLIGAIAAGNSVILKPSENSLATSSLFSKLIPRYLDPNHICVVNGAQEQCSALLDLRFDHIFFTGSGNIGKTVALKAAETLTPITLELGGKCPAVVLDDAPFLVVARRIIWAKILNAGQTCIAPDYVLVSEQSESKLIDAMKTVLREFYPPHEANPKAGHSNTKPDNPSTPDSRYCKIINRRNFDRLIGYLRRTNGEIIELNLDSPVQPKTPDPDTLRIPLTLIRNVKEDDVLMEQELFGPLLPIVTYNQDREDLIQYLHRINQSTPLTIYAFSQSQEKLEFLRRNTKSGQFVCNDLMIQFAINTLPFGGVGTSGLGNYHGYHSFLTFTYKRPTVNFPFWADFLLNSRYPPYTNFKFKFLNILIGAETLKGESNPRPPSLMESLDSKTSSYFSIGKCSTH